LALLRGPGGLGQDSDCTYDPLKFNIFLPSSSSLKDDMASVHYDNGLSDEALASFIVACKDNGVPVVVESHDEVHIVKGIAINALGEYVGRVDGPIKAELLKLTTQEQLASFLMVFKVSTIDRRVCFTVGSFLSNSMSGDAIANVVRTIRSKLKTSGCLMIFWCSMLSRRNINELTFLFCYLQTSLCDVMFFDRHQPDIHHW